MKIELRKISFNERMSEETNCFVADLYINGKKVGYVKNDGRGGCTDYYGDSPEDNAIIREAEAFCKALPKVRSEELKFEYDNNLENVIDEQFEEYDNNLENVIDEQFEEYLKEREGKKMLKHFEKGICFGVPNRSYQIISWEGRKLAEIDKINLQRAYDDIKAKYIKGNVVILNTNLAELGVKI